MSAPSSVCTGAFASPIRYLQQHCFHLQQTRLHARHQTRGSADGWQVSGWLADRQTGCAATELHRLQEHREMHTRRRCVAHRFGRQQCRMWGGMV